MTPSRSPLRGVVNVGTNHKVAGSLVLLYKEVVESRVSVGVSNGAVIDEAKRDHDIGYTPNFAFATALVGTGAYFRSTRTLTAVGWAAIPLR